MLHLLFIGYIILSAYLAFGVWKLDFASKAFEARKRKTLPMWPRDLKTYTLMYKILALLSLIAATALYIYYLVITY